MKLSLLRNQYVLKPDHAIEIQLKSPIEANLLSNIEKDLILFLRDKLENDNVMISHKLDLEVVQKKAYTSAEIFNEMAKKNPDLLKLKDALGLDTEY